MRSIPDDRVRHITGVATVPAIELHTLRHPELADENQRRRVVEQIAWGIAEKLVEFQKVERTVNDATAYYSWGVEVIVPSTPGRRGA